VLLSDSEAEESATAFAAFATEASVGATGATGAGELEVSVRLLDDGALVRWSRAAADRSRCALRWYAGAPPGDRLLAVGDAPHDYVLGELDACKRDGDSHEA
jgi:hypothetical protein